jgi:hypothetical protein
MVANRVARSLGFLWLATGALACGQPEGSAAGTTEVAVVAENGLTANGLTANGLTANGLTANGLTANGLTANGLTANGLTANGLTANGLTAGAMTDPLSRQLMKYIVSCALSAQQSLTLTIAGTAYTFPGSIGLAPQWGTAHGSCDGSCQRWVSACVLARVDAAGIDREISIRGPDLALLPSSWSELSQYTQREATYFGNIFIPGQPRFLCLSPGQTSDERACGPSLDACPMTVLGSCSRDCAGAGLFGDFDLCSDAGRFGTGHTYFESVTVFLPK